ncbi:MAG TPA: HAMP domain-containing sensor histidine kinase [Clostridiales bacterium]|nr:HAMP domain-containing sensor histidine kinase [Clostridiales bacterium]
MDILRNPWVKKNLLMHLAIGTAATIIGFVAGKACGIMLLCLSLLFTIIHFLSDRKRYRKISELSDEINKILHSRHTLDFNEYAEGELSILSSEIYKMTVRMREQAELLKNDKQYLADSMANISHQIRTPLTSANLIAALLQKPDLTYERRLKLTQEMMSLLEHIDHLVTVILKLSKFDAGTVELKKETVYLSDLIRKASDPLLIPMELRNQQLLVNINGNGSFVGDLAWTAEAVGNVLKNCMEHTPEGGMIRIDASENALFTEIVISDNGSGIDEDDLPHLFERFYRGKNTSGQNYGIGLALARLIISEQNGTIKAENAREGGAKFTIRFYKNVV